MGSASFFNELETGNELCSLSFISFFNELDTRKELCSIFFRHVTNFTQDLAGSKFDIDDAKSWSAVEKFTRIEGIDVSRGSPYKKWHLMTSLYYVFIKNINILTKNFYIKKNMVKNKVIFTFTLSKLIFYRFYPRFSNDPFVQSVTYF